MRSMAVPRRLQATISSPSDNLGDFQHEKRILLMKFVEWTLTFFDDPHFFSNHSASGELALPGLAHNKQTFIYSWLAVRFRSLKREISEGLHSTQMLAEE
jgi:hypothetical protein